MRGDLWEVGKLANFVNPGVLALEERSRDRVVGTCSILWVRDKDWDNKWSAM